MTLKWAYTGGIILRDFVLRSFDSMNIEKLISSRDKIYL